MNNPATQQRPAETAPHRFAMHGVPILFATLLLVYLGGNYLLERRQDVITDCASVLVVDKVSDVDTLVSELAPLKPKQMPVRDSTETEGLKQFVLRFPWPSALHLWVEFDPQNGKIANYSLVYFASEQVDLITHNGSGPKPNNGLAFVFTAITLVALMLHYAVWHLGYNAQFLIGILALIALSPMILEACWMILHFGFPFLW